MSPAVEVSASGVRSKFAFLFRSISELYLLKYGQSPSTKFEDIQKSVSELEKDGHLNDYLVANLSVLFRVYPSLRPGMHNSKEKLSNLDSLLDLIVGDVCAEIAEISQQVEKNEREALIRWLEAQ